jgi:hypothetical protein
MTLDPAQIERLILLLEESRLIMERCKILSLRIEEELKACLREQI